MNVNEEISIENYQSKWNSDFEQEKEKIVASIEKYKFCIEHIGSTSIKGMCAKPIIDILVGVEKFPPCEEFMESIIRLDYEFMKEASVSDRLYFVKRSLPYFNLHIVKYGGDIWNDDIMFRDFLRDHPNIVQEYSSLKKKIINKGIHSLIEYSAEKAPYIKSLLEQIRR